jgi:hypothetical protein
VEVTYQFTDPDVATFDLYDCDPGCKTYPIGSKMGGKARIALNSISSAPECQDVKNHVLFLLEHGLIRFYTVNDGNDGDQHPSSRGKLYDRIHLYSALWKTGNERELALTLMHEGFHSWYDIADNTAAEGFAGQCVVN